MVKFSYIYFQLNTDRNVKRRIPQSISSLTQPFDREKFNFTKIPPEEILFDIVYDKEIGIVANDKI